MSTLAFAKKRNQPTPGELSHLIQPVVLTYTPNFEGNSEEHLYKRIANQADPEMLQHGHEKTEAGSKPILTGSLGHDFSRMLVYPATAIKLQAKLVINTPGDIYEQEADRVADQVVNMPQPQHTCKCGGTCPKCRQGQAQLKQLQTKRTLDHSADLAAPPIVHEVMSLSGQPLDPTTRAYMEPRFGYDFSRVRIHTDEKSARSAQSLDARAYTIGRDVVFGSKQYVPGSLSGRKLLAHELTHVVQQSQSRLPDNNLTTKENISTPEHAMHTAAIHIPQRLTPAQPVVQRLGPAGAVGAGAAAGLVLGAVSFDAALKYGQSLSTRYPGWLSVLPTCPCNETDAIGAPGSWEPDQNPLLSWFHPGANSSYRSKSTFASVPGTAHGQQCTYDSSGHLITDGPGAGTPDVWSPVTNTSDHLVCDAATWQVLGWRIYNRYWQPNRGNGCPSSRGSNSLIRRFSEFIP